MKKAIRLAIFVILFFVLEFSNTQTLFATEKKPLVLTNKNSNAAQKFINSTKIEPSKQIDKTKEPIKSPVSTASSTPNNSLSLDKFQISNTDSEEKTEPIDEGSLPLFSNKLSTSTTQLSSPVTNNISATLSLFSSLIGIIILALIASWFIQKKSLFNTNNFGKVLGVVPLDNKRFIYIVDIMGKMLVLGVTESNINLLTEITDKDTIDTYRLKFGQTPTPGLDHFFPFLNKLNKDNITENQNDNSITEAQEKIISNRKSKAVNDSLEQQHQNRIERLKNMILK